MWWSHGSHGLTERQCRVVSHGLLLTLTRRWGLANMAPTPNSAQLRNLATLAMGPRPSTSPSTQSHDCFDLQQGSHNFRNSSEIFSSIIALFEEWKSNHFAEKSLIHVIIKDLLVIGVWQSAVEPRPMTVHGLPWFPSSGPMLRQVKGNENL